MLWGSWAFFSAGSTGGFAAGIQGGSRGGAEPDGLGVVEGGFVLGWCLCLLVLKHSGRQKVDWARESGRVSRLDLE